MYSPGDTLYLVSGTLSVSDLADINLTEAHAALDSPGRIFGMPKPADVNVQQQPLIYQMRITHAYTPFTMSVVCRVRLTAVYQSPAALAPFVPLPTEAGDTAGLEVERPTNVVGPEYVLKLYDHRCYVNVRTEFGHDRPYSLENARAYHRYHQGPPAPYFSEFFSRMPGLSHQDPWTESDMGLFEAWLEVDAGRTFETEVSVYNLLADLQGICVPKLFDTISCSTSFAFETDTTPTQSSEHEGHTDSSLPKDHPSLDDVDLTRLATGHRIYGILMEFVPGVSLRSFIHTCLLSRRQDLREKIATIANEAVAVILRVGKYPVLNRDIRLDNMLVRQSFMATLGLEAAGPAGSNIQTLESEATSLSEQSSPQANTGDLPKPSTISPCVAIDFGKTRFRFDDETDEQWRCAKLFDDEESAMAFALSWEMREIFKKILSSEQSLEGEPIDVQKACSEAQKALWTYKPTRPWYRKLSPEDQMAYESDLTWGQHPKNYQ